MSDEFGIYDTLHDDIPNGAEFSKLIIKNNENLDF
jgi:hypothetical protein